MSDDDQGVPPDRFAPEPVVSDIGAIPDREYAPFSFTAGDDKLIFQFTAEEFIKVLSALRNGAYMTYGNAGSAVYWSFLRNVDYPIMICASIIDCITNDPDTRQALADYLVMYPNSTQYPRDQQLPTGVTSSNFLSNNPDCDPDILYAQCIGTIETAIQLTTDFLDQWEVYDASGKVAAAILQAIPGVGIVADASGVEGVIEYANAIADSIKTNFEADNTLEYRETLACAFFCLAKDDCELSVDDCLTILQSRLSGQLTFTNVAELFLSLLDANITGINVADLYLCAFFGLVKLGNWILPVSWGIDIFAKTVSTFDTPNNDWEELCVDCPDPDLWEIVSCGYGTVVKNSGPSHGPGTYSFTFTSQLYTGSIWLGDFRWGNTGEQFVVNSITATPAPGGGVGTGYHRNPGDAASCANQAGITYNLPVADGTTFYGGVAMDTFPAYPWHIDMNITVSTI